MQLTSRPVLDRAWLSSRARASRPRCAPVRVLAFNENGKPPASGAAAVVSTPPLTPEAVSTLPPAALASALAGRTETDARVLEAVARRVVQSSDDFEPQALVDLLSAFAAAAAAAPPAAGRVPRDCLAIAAACLTARMSDLQPRDLVRLAGACAALELRATDLLAELCTRADEPAVLSALSPPDLVVLLTALARLQHRCPPLFSDAAEALADAMALPRGDTGCLSPEQAVGAAWAFAEEGLYHRPLFDGASAVLMGRMQGLTGTHLAQLAWAYATVRSADENHRAVWDRDLYESIAGQCLVQRVTHYPPRALVTLLWAFASVPHYDAPLFDAACVALCPHLAAARAPAGPPGSAGAHPADPRRPLGPPDLVALAWALQRVAHKGPAAGAALDALGAAALACSEQLDGEDLTTIALAFPAAKAYSPKFFRFLVDEAQARPQLFGQVALLDLIRLVSGVQHRDPEYYGPAVQVLLDHVHQAFLDAPVDKQGCMNPYRFG
ncbi:hypothetical protein HYH03_006248 [Edaphochlamys debaryana]|uniref:Uncharacterized protein n=1 Tax=Edaphochlamys debaryana TaxID=47281 RepID=A0A835Y482_9CHLO|nr:hypothetical protein HYH03_006248 [Edaphochlamys debaryana]|eukprot:KAG2495648.1 hypothetical protein HYH03_006248 [Edaphochlamys debaryana]